MNNRCDVGFFGRALQAFNALGGVVIHVAYNDLPVDRYELPSGKILFVSKDIANAVMAPTADEADRIQAFFIGGLKHQ